MKINVKLSTSSDIQSQNLIARGINASAKIKDIAIAHAVLKGTLTAEQALSFLKGPVGVWWYLVGPDQNHNQGPEIEDAQDFALREDDLTQGFGKFMLEELESGAEKVIDVEFPVVLLAKRPVGWDPDENPLMDMGLNGNSFINTKKWKTVNLVFIQYYSAGGWVTKAVNKTVRL